MGLFLQGIIIRAPNIINHEVGNSIFPSSNNGLGVEKFGVFITKFDPLLSGLLEPKHLLLIKHLIVLILKIIL